MSLELYYHPLASFCWKVLMALYETGTPFTPHLVDLADETSRAELEQLWPFAKFPLLMDAARARAIPESSIIIEYLDQHYPGEPRLVPSAPDLAREARFWDRFFDQYLQAPMQKIVADKLRPSDSHDPYGVREAKATLETAYDELERRVRAESWMLGDQLSMADCSAMPALYYANRVAPLGAGRPKADAYLRRLLARPSAARVLEAAQPYFAMFPG